jgi:hypothetical protein
MDKDAALKLLREALSEIAVGNAARTNDFASLRAVDAKIRDVRLVLEGISDLPPSLLSAMDKDIDFDANSRRVRLEALANYIRSAIKFTETGAFEKPKKVIHAPPDLSKLTTPLPGLKSEIDKRWREAQRCVHVEAYTAAVILMGSILEGLLLSRALLEPAKAYTAASVPKDKMQKPLAITDWTLSALIDVAADVQWIKSDRKAFSHALRDSRNIVHPWGAVHKNADFDAATCKTTWSVLDAAVHDLLRSI